MLSGTLGVFLANSGLGLRSRAPGLLISDRGSTPRLTMRRQSAPTNATPRPLAPL